MINIVCGCPGSGKTTYLRNHMQDGDLVVDVAWIYCALSGNQGTIKESKLLPYMMGMRNMLYDMIQQRNDVDAWILAGAPIAEDRQALSNRFGVDVMLINKTRQECIDQVRQDESRQEEQNFFLWLVDDWHDRYTPRDADVLIDMK